MYGENDHTNRGDVAAPAPDVHEFNFPRRHYQRYQLEFLKQAAKLAPGSRLLEYGCGDGFYLEFSRSLGFTPVGIEYNADLVERLRGRSNLEIYNFEEFSEKYAGERFDVVHFGHILEHLPDPRKAIHDVLEHTHADTVFLVDGPVEANICLSRLIIDLGSRLKRKKENYYVPQHLSFTNYRSQLGFFEHMGFDTLVYKVLEQPWPLPDRPNWYSPVSLLLYCLSRTSMVLSDVLTRHGNVFHYTGRLRRSVD
jgi:hypothetical protein